MKAIGALTLGIFSMISEAGAGNAEAASRRLAALEGIPSLAVTRRGGGSGGSVCPTWNCTHIANAAIRDKIERTCGEAGFEPPIVCTPEELME